SSSFLAAKIVVFQAGPARRPFGLVAREKNLPHALRERIFSRQALPETAEKQTGGSTRNKNAYPCRPCITQKI
ncbi:hypothetical protein, partial [Phocaeicola vulgatus]|uniref:hypothetical protein n=1 Tax=Phocaeicola vulgatus TaxID=821 RepID=UPI001C218DC0